MFNTVECDQMDLKQKQANVSEARSSRKQAEAMARQGRIILPITVVTIIFLPISFRATWFGMNANSMTEGGKLGAGFTAAIVFPISITIAPLALGWHLVRHLGISWWGCLREHLR